MKYPQPMEAPVAHSHLPARILLLAGVVGLLVGGALGAMKTEKEPAQMDIDDLNIDQIQQYAS